jgi:hypothetical protein
MLHLHTKIRIWAYFGGPRNRKCWYIFNAIWNISSFGIFYGHFGKFFHVLVYSTLKNLATLYNTSKFGDKYVGLGVNVCFCLKQLRWKNGEENVRF